MDNTINRFNEEEFLEKMATSMTVLGFDPTLIEHEEQTFSISTKMIGYEETGAEVVVMFLPYDEVIGEHVQILQTYISIINKPFSEEELVGLEKACNQCNVSNLIGTYGLQQEQGRVCLKNAIALRAENGLKTAMESAMDQLVLMALSLDNHYASIMEAIDDHES